jgi:hypothetical protein
VPYKGLEDLKGLVRFLRAHKGLKDLARFLKAL